MFYPAAVHFIMERLIGVGYACFVVGGAVRDYVMEEIPTDYDLATNATPNEIKELFLDNALVLTGEKHGTIGIVINRKLYEITTFRKETTYLKHRWPIEVTFIEDLKIDLSRRDFTINAMALSENLEILDYFGGKDDIKNKIIKTVGEPSVRFQEDALRILRAFRFKSKLGFSIEENTFKAMNLEKHLLKNLSIERTYLEVRQIFMGPYIKTFTQSDVEILYEIMPWLIYCDLNNLKLVDDFLGRFLSLTITLPTITFEKMLVAVKFTKFELATLRNVRKKLCLAINEKADVKLLLNDLSEYEYKIWLSIQSLENQNKVNELLQKIIIKQELIYIKELNISGHDLIALDVPHRYRQRVLERLYLEVIYCRLENKRSELMKAVSTMLELVRGNESL